MTRNLIQIVPVPNLNYLLRLGCMILMLSVIGACSVTDTDQPPADGKADDISRLLDEGILALESNRLTTPEDDNAYDRFRAVLALDPANADARDGINRIVEKYLGWAMDNADRGNLRRARQYVTRAETIDPGHPNIAPVVNMINDREESRTARYRLDAGAVIYRRPAEIRFDAIADNVERHRAFVVIRAPDDAAGRWLYQQLNQRVSFRIEARFEISSRPEIILNL